MAWRGPREGARPRLEWEGAELVAPPPPNNSPGLGPEEGTCCDSDRRHLHPIPRAPNLPPAPPLNFPWGPRQVWAGNLLFYFTRHIAAAQPSGELPGPAVGQSQGVGKETTAPS